MILTVWRMISTWSWAHGAGACTLGEFVNLKDTMRSAKHWRSRQGPLAERLREENTSLVYLVCSGICLGKVPFLRLEVKVRKASWGLRVAQLPCSLPLLEDKSKCSVLLALPSAFKGSEVRRWQIFLVLSLGWMILPPVNLESNLALPLLEEKKVRGASFITPPLYKFYSFSPPTWQYFLDFCDIPNIWISRKEQENDSLF